MFLAGQAMLFGVFALLGAGLAGLAPLLLMLLLYGGFYAATDGILTAMASAVLSRHLRTTGLAMLGTAVAIAHLMAAVAWGAIWQHSGIATANSRVHGRSPGLDRLRDRPAAPYEDQHRHPHRPGRTGWSSVIGTDR